MASSSVSEDLLVSTAKCIIIRAENYISKKDKEGSAKTKGEIENIAKRRAQPFPKHPPIQIYSNLFFSRGQRTFRLVNREPNVTCLLYTFEVASSKEIMREPEPKIENQIIKSKVGFSPELRSFFLHVHNEDPDFLLECTYQNLSRRSESVGEKANQGRDKKKNGEEGNSTENAIGTGTANGTGKETEPPVPVFHKFHSVVRITPELSEKTKYWKSRDSMPPDLIIIAVDSLSRSTMMNYLPRTFEYLQYTGFKDMRGFTSLTPSPSPVNVNNVTATTNASEKYSLKIRSVMNNPKTSNEEQELDSDISQEEDKWINTLFTKLSQFNYVTFYGEEEARQWQQNHKGEGEGDSSNSDSDKLISQALPLRHKKDYNARARKSKISQLRQREKLAKREQQRIAFEKNLTLSFSLGKVLRAARISKQFNLFQGNDKTLLFDYSADLVTFLKEHAVPLAVFLRLKVASVSHTSELTHDEHLSFEYLDHHLHSTLRKFMKSKSRYLKAHKSTEKKYLVVLCSFQSQSQSEQGKEKEEDSDLENVEFEASAYRKGLGLDFERMVDERLPVLQIRFPHGHPDDPKYEHSSLKWVSANSKNIITPWDLLKTVTNVASQYGQGPNPNPNPNVTKIKIANNSSIKVKAVSQNGTRNSTAKPKPFIKMLESFDIASEKIPQTRSCSSAGLSENHCPCSSDFSFNPRTNPLTAIYIARLAVEKMNRQLISGNLLLHDLNLESEYDQDDPEILRNKCSPLIFDSVTDVQLQLRSWDKNGFGNGTDGKFPRRIPREKVRRPAPVPTQKIKTKAETKNIEHLKFEFIRIRFRTQTKAIFSVVIRFDVVLKSFTFRNGLDWIVRFDKIHPDDYKCLKFEYGENENGPVESKRNSNSSAVAVAVTQPQAIIGLRRDGEESEKKLQVQAMGTQAKFGIDFERRKYLRIICHCRK